MRWSVFSTMLVGGLFSIAFAVSASAASVTATGCLVKGDDPGEFELTQATGGADDDYDLVPDKGVDLSAHVGHKVEVTGEMTSEPTEKNEKSAVKSEEKADPDHQLKVKSLRHIAAKCP